MIPGVNPKQLKQMMRQMGMSQEEINASQVIIKTPDKEFIFDSPDVQKVQMQGQTTFQIVGEYREEESKIEVNISKEDIKTVADQARVSEDEAKKALEENNGDIAEAIVSLSN